MENDEAFAWPDEWEKAIPAVTRLVLSICYRHRLGASDSDDILQITLLRLMIEAESRKRHFNTVALLCGWFGKFARSQIAKRRNRQRRDGVSVGQELSNLPEEPDNRVDPEDFAAYVALLDDPREQEVLKLRYVDGLKLEEIGERLGFSTTQAHNLHQRALEKLRRRLST